MIGNRIRLQRKKLGLSSRDLAKASGISAGMISEIENGKRNLSSAALLKLSNALGLSLDFLMNGNPDSLRANNPEYKEVKGGVIVSLLGGKSAAFLPHSYPQRSFSAEDLRQIATQVDEMPFDAISFAYTSKEAEDIMLRITKSPDGCVHLANPALELIVLLEKRGYKTRDSSPGVIEIKDPAGEVGHTIRRIAAIVSELTKVPLDQIYESYKPEQETRQKYARRLLIYIASSKYDRAAVAEALGEKTHVINDACELIFNALSREEEGKAAQLIEKIRSKLGHL